MAMHEDISTNDEDIWLAGVGAMVIAEMQDNKLFESLLEEGKAIDRALSRANSDLRERIPHSLARLATTSRYRDVL